jgi:hypothetical protein
VTAKDLALYADCPLWQVYHVEARGIIGQAHGRGRRCGTAVIFGEVDVIRLRVALAIYDQDKRRHRATGRLNSVAYPTLARVEAAILATYAIRQRRAQGEVLMVAERAA